MGGDGPGPDGPRRGPGRPSLTERRRAQIVDAFVGLIGRHGLDTVTIADVAAAAGVSRAGVRHFAGNRADLIGHAVRALTHRYETAIRAALGERPDAHDLVRLLFSDGWVRDRPAEDRAFDVLLQEAMRDDAARPLVRGAYEALTAELVAALRRRGARVPVEDLEDAAYLIVCLAEQSAALQVLGFPRARSEAAAAHAVRIADRVAPASDHTPG